MKYPESFTLVGRCSGFTLEVKYDQTTGTYMLNYGNGFKGFHKEYYIDYLISAYYDIKPEKYHQYPDNFSFYHDTTAQMYDMVKLPHHELWACTDHTDGPQWVISGVTYTADEIAEHFAKGDWRKVKAEEPSLVTPLVLQHKHCEGTFTLNKFGPDIYGSRGDEHCENWSEEDCKEYIKSGAWIVKSVGPQEPAETPTSPLTDNTALATKIDSDAVLEASERFERLAQAIEDVNISLESFKTAFADVQEMIAPKVECVGTLHRGAVAYSTTTIGKVFNEATGEYI